MNEKLVVIISALAVFNLILISFLSWVKSFHRASYFWLGWLFFATAAAILDNIFIFTGNGNILLYHSAQLLNLSWGAYLILFVRNLYLPENRIARFNWKLFVPSFLYLFFIFWCVLYPSWARDTLALAKQGKMTAVGVLCNLTICFYSIGSNILLLWKESVRGKYQKIKELLWVLLILQLLAFAPFVLKLDLDYIILYMPVFGQIFFLYLFFRFTYSTHIFHDPGPTTETNSMNPTKYAALKIDDERKSEICSRIIQLMDSQKPYLRMEYTLTEMARDLNIMPNTLSMILNSSLNSSFPDYINSFRIKAALLLLNDFHKRNLTIETIAYESGFNNRTSFYQAFKKQTGTLPRDYIRKIKEGCPM